MNMKTLLFNLVFYRNLKTYLYLDLFPLEPFPEKQPRTDSGLFVFNYYTIQIKLGRENKRHCVVFLHPACFRYLRLVYLTVTFCLLLCPVGMFYRNIVERRDEQV